MEEDQRDRYEEFLEAIEEELTYGYLSYPAEATPRSGGFLFQAEGGDLPNDEFKEHDLAVSMSERRQACLGIAHKDSVTLYVHGVGVSHPVSKDAEDDYAVTAWLGEGDPPADVVAEFEAAHAGRIAENELEGLLRIARDLPTFEAGLAGLVKDEHYEAMTAINAAIARA